ncbi:Molecular chaperone (small heat shock protein) (plasmid) [Cupriavidus necator H850]|nr:Molecular chaperone (small heat shock protein) [Cupriavidus necator H850]
MNDTTKMVERNQNAVTIGQEDKSTPTMTLLPAVDIVEDSNGVTLWKRSCPPQQGCGCNTRKFASRTSHALSR